MDSILICDGKNCDDILQAMVPDFVPRFCPSIGIDTLLTNNLYQVPLSPAYLL